MSECPDPALSNRWQRFTFVQALLQGVVEFVDIVNFASQDRDEARRLGVTLEQDRAPVVCVALGKDRLHFPERVNVAGIGHARDIPRGVPHHPVVLARPRDVRRSAASWVGPTAIPTNCNAA